MSIILMVKEGIVKAIEFKKSKRKYEIFNFVKFKIEDEIPIDVLIKKKLKEANFKGRYITLVSTSSLIRSEIKSYPKMSRKDAKLVIERDIKKIAQDEDLDIKFVLIGEREERERKVQDYLISYASKEYLFNTVKFLDSTGYTPKAIVPAIQSFLIAGKNFMNRKENYGFLNIVDGMVDFVLLKKDFSFISFREFPLVSEGKVLSSDDLELIIVEINRTIQFFKQKNRGENIERIVLSANVEDIEKIAQVLNENLSSQVELFEERWVKNKLVFKRIEFENINFIISEIFPLIGALFLDEEKKYINFLPKEYFDEKMFKPRLLSFSLGYAAVILLMILGAFYTEKVRISVKNDLKKVNESFYKMERRINEIEAVVNKRKEIFKMIETLNLKKSIIREMILFFENISVSKPYDLKIKNLDIKNEDNQIRFKIEGIVDSGDSNLNSAIFIDFKEKLSKLEFLKIDDFSINQRNEEKKDIVERIKSSGRDLLSPDGRKEESGVYAPANFVLKGRFVL